jgi:hypothetical protein
MKKLVLPAMAATLALGGAASALTAQNQHVPVTASVAPNASQASADYAQLLARTGYEAHVKGDIVIKQNQRPVDESTFDN